MVVAVAVMSIGGQLLQKTKPLSAMDCPAVVTEAAPAYALPYNHNSSFHINAIITSPSSLQYVALHSTSPAFSRIDTTKKGFTWHRSSGLLAAPIQGISRSQTWDIVAQGLSGISNWTTKTGSSKRLSGLPSPLR